MKTTQAEGEAAAFLTLFGDIAKTVHSDYIRNNHAKGLITEFVREVQPGVYASHNAYCKKGLYFHCFCLTLHLDLAKPYLNSPFTAGGRFDHNREVNMAIQRDLGRHMLLSSTHHFRKGCDRIIERCCQEAEMTLLPFYLKVFNNAKEPLRHLLNALTNDSSIIAPQAGIRGSGYSIGDLDCDMDMFSKMFRNASNTQAEFIHSILASKPELFTRLRKHQSVSHLALT